MAERRFKFTGPATQYRSSVAEANWPCRNLTMSSGQSLEVSSRTAAP